MKRNNGLIFAFVSSLLLSGCTLFNYVDSGSTIDIDTDESSETTTESETETGHSSQTETQTETETESESETQTESETQAQRVDISSGSESGAISNPGTWYYWNDAGYEGSTVTVNEVYLLGSEVHASYSVTGNCNYCFQLFYRNSQLTYQKTYTLSFDIYSESAGNVTINHIENNPVSAGWNKKSINYMENNSQSSFLLAIPSSLGDNDIIIKNLKWELVEEDPGNPTDEITYPDGYDTLVFQDEFNGTSLDTTKWGFDIGTGEWGWGNKEAQYYTDHNHSVKDGVLSINAKKESYMSSSYTSSRLVTRNKVHFTYGYIEARIALPVGSGFWPAFWMMPNDNYYGGWPYSGEIDIMEARGRLPYITSSALHYNPRGNGDHDYSTSEYHHSTSIASFHKFAVKWEEDVISFYVDDVLNYSANKNSWYTKSNKATGNERAPFDKDFYIILNLAIGGEFDGGVIPDDSLFPAEMKIDYVRWFK